MYQKDNEKRGISLKPSFQSNSNVLGVKALGMSLAL